MYVKYYYHLLLNWNFVESYVFYLDFLLINHQNVVLSNWNLMHYRTVYIVFLFISIFLLCYYLIEQPHVFDLICLCLIVYFHNIYSLLKTLLFGLLMNFHLILWSLQYFIDWSIKFKIYTEHLKANLQILILLLYNMLISLDFVESWALSN